MKIDDELLNKLETLSSLKVEKDRREEIVSQLSEIVSFVENLSELELDGEDASFNAIKGGTPLRKDISASNSEVMDIMLKHAPNKEDRFFCVPPIIE